MRANKNLIFKKRNRSIYSNHRQFIFLTLFILSCGFIFFPNDSFGQRKPDDLVPPPLNILTKDEQKQLKAETKMKNRTKLALELMDLRLIKSQKLADENEFRKSLDELGGFQALIRNTLSFLKSQQTRKSSLKNFKRFEMTLREFLPKLELVRREMPVEYSYHVREMIKFVRRARSKAIEPFYGDTVIPEGSK
jgi:hypothetical protein